MKQNFFKFTAYDIAEIAILVAIAIIFDLDGLKIRTGGGAGSISITMVALIIIALRFNVYKSFLAIGVVYGLLTNIIDGYGFVTYPIDYLLAYGSISLISLFRKYIFPNPDNYVQSYLVLVPTILVAGALRIFFSTISGIILYDNTFMASLLYNAPRIGTSLLISAAVVVFLFPAVVTLHKRRL